MPSELIKTVQALTNSAPLNMDFSTMTASINKQEGLFSNGNSVTLRLKYENAESLSLELVDGDTYFFHKQKDGYWTLNFRNLSDFYYVKVILNGEWVLSPYLPIAFGDNHAMNFLDIGWSNKQLNEDIPHGSIHRQTYISSINNTKKFCYVYIPSDHYQTDGTYPVLYLQHGYGENELGWIYQGRISEIADQLLHEKKMVPMIIVMSDGMIRSKDFNNNWIHTPAEFTKELIHDIMPMIEAKYPIKKGMENHALAGLSMGSLQTTMTICKNPNLFAWIGVFSGFMSNIFDQDNTHLDLLFKHSDSFNQNTKLFFRAMGKSDPFWEIFAHDDSLCQQHNIHCKRMVYDGGHTWNVWRQCIQDFLPFLFRDFNC